MKCSRCDKDNLEHDDNFCYNCGHLTSTGNNYFRSDINNQKILNGEFYKVENKFTITLVIFVFLIITLIISLLIRKEDIFKPFNYIKKQTNSYIYGYKTSIIRTNNKYKEKNINSYLDASSIIKKDFEEQDWLCNKNTEIAKIELSLEDNHNIISVNFCDLSSNEARKIEEVINKIYSIFPNIDKALTNITITNASTNKEYIAMFQPMYQFVNIDENIKEYSKVNKTQILLNSYYFLNQHILSNRVQSIVGDNLYVKDATWESMIAHELGHYISFCVLLKENNIDNITLVTNDNYELINNVLDKFNSGETSSLILNEALNNYNKKYFTNLDLKTFATLISKYASTEDENGNIITDETIAEAVHDYYLHDLNMQKASKEIIDVLNEKLR